MVRRGPRLLLALVCVLGCAALAPALASAAEPGAIEGTVTEPGGPATQAEICAAGRGGGPEACEPAEGNGDYRIEGLAEGEYEVRFFASGRAERVYHEVLPGNEPTWVQVEEGQTTPNVDEALPENGALAGTLLSAGGPIADSIVCVDSSTQYFPACAVTNGSGEYELAQLPPGEFSIEFTGWVCASGVSCEKERCETSDSCTHPYVAQYSFGKPINNPEELDMVTVEPGQTTPIADVTLLPGGTIEGTVTLAALGSPPLAGIVVCAGSEVDPVETRCATTDESGDYAIEGVADSAHLQVKFAEACAEEPCPGRFVTQYFDGKGEPEEATPIDATGARTVTGVDAVMVEAKPQAPSFATDPLLSGTPAVGSTLSCAGGTWVNHPTTIAFAWLRNGVAIGGQTDSTYLVTSADEGKTLACAVAIANSAGSAQALSNPVTVPVVLPGQVTVSTGSTSSPGPATPTAQPTAAEATKYGRATSNGKATAGPGVTVGLKCTGDRPCKGSLKLVYTSKYKNSKGQTKTKKVVIGNTSFTIAAGSGKTVTVRLNSTGERLLRQAGKQGLKVRLTGTGVKARQLIVTG